MGYPELTFLHGNHRPACTAIMDKRFQGYETLQFMASGAVRLQYDDRKFCLEGAWFWSHFPGPRTRLCSAHPPATWDHRHIAFSGPLTAQWRSEGLFPFMPPQIMPISGTPFADLFDELIYRAQHPGGWGHRQAVNILERILIELADARREEVTQVPWLQKVFDGIATAKAFSPEYAAIAQTVGMSLRTLRERFKKATGMPIHAYALQHRMNRARGLLGETDCPIKEIAEQLGYEDVFFFTRQFKQFTGSTPAVYRKSRL